MSDYYFLMKVKVVKLEEVWRMVCQAQLLNDVDVKTELLQVALTCIEIISHILAVARGGL